MCYTFAGSDLKYEMPKGPGKVRFEAASNASVWGLKALSKERLITHFVLNCENHMNSSFLQPNSCSQAVESLGRIREAQTNSMSNGTKISTITRM